MTVFTGWVAESCKEGAAVTCNLSGRCWLISQNFEKTATEWVSNLVSLSQVFADESACFLQTTGLACHKVFGAELKLLSLNNSTQLPAASHQPLFYHSFTQHSTLQQALKNRNLMSCGCAKPVWLRPLSSPGFINITLTHCAILWYKLRWQCSWPPVQFLLILHKHDRKVFWTWSQRSWEKVPFNTFSPKTDFIVVFKTKSNKSASEKKKKNPHKEETPQTLTALQKRLKLCDCQKFKKKKKVQLNTFCQWSG